MKGNNFSKREGMEEKTNTTDIMDSTYLLRKEGGKGINICKSICTLLPMQLHQSHPFVSCDSISQWRLGPLTLQNPAIDIKTVNKEIKNRHQLVVPYMVLEREKK